jgi:hypothetical protein
VVTAFLTLFTSISFLLKVEKKGKERLHTWGEYVEGIWGNLLTLAHNTHRKDKYFFI